MEAEELKHIVVGVTQRGAVQRTTFKGYMAETLSDKLTADMKRDNNYVFVGHFVFFANGEMYMRQEDASGN